MSVVTVMRSVPLASLLLATLLGACGSQPGVRVTVADQNIPTVLASASRITAWGYGEHGDAFPTELPLSTVRASTPVTLTIEAGQGASEIRGWLYDKDAPSATGGPTEEFDLHGRSGTYTSRTIVAGRTYEVVVNVKWTGLLVQGEETHAFRLTVAAP